MKLKLLHLLLINLTLYGCKNNQIIVSSNSAQTDIPREYNYKEVSDYELVWDSIFDVESTNYYVYFYSTTCSHCEELKNFIVETALNRGDIYFVKATSKDQLTNDTKKLIGAGIPEDIWILGYPSLLKISNKKVTKNLAGTNQIKAELK